MTLNEWALKHGVPWAALADLRDHVLGESQTPPGSAQGGSESAVQAEVRLAAAAKGWYLWRNNCGALKDARGVPVRYGLANDNTAINRRFKSGDLIGIEPVLITKEHLGHRIGRFVSLECKRADWSFKGTPREVAQSNWAQLVGSLGGRAKFVRGSDDLG